MAGQHTVFTRPACTRAAAIVVAGTLMLGATGPATAATLASPNLTVARWQLALARGHAKAQAFSTLQVKVANAH